MCGVPRPRPREDVCDQGFYQDWQGGCVACPKGTYSSVQNATSCTKCPNGAPRRAAALPPCACANDSRARALATWPARQPRGSARCVCLAVRGGQQQCRLRLAPPYPWAGMGLTLRRAHCTCRQAASPAPGPRPPTTPAPAPRLTVGAAACAPRRRRPRHTLSAPPGSSTSYVASTFLSDCGARRAAALAFPRAARITRTALAGRAPRSLRPSQPVTAAAMRRRPGFWRPAARRGAAEGPPPSRHGAGSGAIAKAPPAAPCPHPSQTSARQGLATTELQSHGEPPPTLNPAAYLHTRARAAGAMSH